MNLTEITFLKQDQIKIDDETISTYGKDWTSYFNIKCSGVLFPESVEDVQKIVIWAKSKNIKLIPSGGRTGLSGGAVARNGEVIVSMDRLNKILDWNPVDRLVHCQAGVIIEELQNFAKNKNLFYPIDFAARGSAQLGGSIATNAGGIKVVRYGMTRQWVQGLTVVTGTGDILKLNNGLIKNASGYDFKNLFVGSEGTLGFIVEANMLLTTAPHNLKTLLLAPESLSKIMDIFKYFQDHSLLCAFEMFSEKALEYVLKNTGAQHPFSNKSDYYIVLEVECPYEKDEDNLMQLLEKCFENEWIIDGHMAQSEVQAKNFWRYREQISESLSPYSPYKNDLSVRISRVPEFLKSLDQILSEKYPTWKVVWFGHVGDGNLHINILRPEQMTKENFVEECQKVDEVIFQKIKEFDGSISAEHGVGLTKKPFLHFCRSQNEILLMKNIKKIFDPEQIINPDKIF